MMILLHEFDRKAVGRAEVALTKGDGPGTKANIKRTGKSRGGQGAPHQSRAGNSGR